jgi:hypothetical protein
MKASRGEFFCDDDDDGIDAAKKARVATVRTVEAATRARESLGPDRRRGGATAHADGGPTDTTTVTLGGPQAHYGDQTAATVAQGGPTSTAAAAVVDAIAAAVTAAIRETATNSARRGISAASTAHPGTIDTNHRGATAAAASVAAGSAANTATTPHGTASKTTTATARPGLTAATVAAQGRLEDVEEEFLEALAAQEAADNAEAGIRRVDTDDDDDEINESDDESEEDDDDDENSDDELTCFCRVINFSGFPMNIFQEGVDPERVQRWVTNHLGWVRSPGCVLSPDMVAVICLLYGPSGGQGVGNSPHSSHITGADIDREIAKHMVARLLGFQPPWEISPDCASPNLDPATGQLGGPNEGVGGGNSPRTRPPPSQGGAGDLGNPPPPRQGEGGNFGPPDVANFGPHGFGNPSLQGNFGPHGVAQFGPHGGGNFGPRPPQGGATPKSGTGKRYHVYDDEGNFCHSFCTNEYGVITYQSGTNDNGSSGSFA